MTGPHDPAVARGSQIPGIDNVQRLALLAAAAGFGVLVVLALLNGWNAFFRAYFYGFLFWMAFPIASIGFLCLNRIAFGTWGVLIRRPLEASAATIALTAVLALPILSPPGLQALYPWAQPAHAESTTGSPDHDHAAGAEAELDHAPGAEADHDHAGSEADHSGAVHGFHSPKGHKAAWFQRGFFYGRAIGYFVVWGLLAFLLNSWARQQDTSANPAASSRLRALGAPGLILLFMTATFALFDWSMSLDPNWYSTIYGAMLLIGMAQATLALSLIVLTRIVDAGLLGEGLVTTSRLRDLGNLLLALTMLWAYTSFSQFLIMWSGNIAEEVVWYLRRSNGGWEYVVAFLMAFGFFGPFLTLLFRSTKHSHAHIRRVAWFILFIHVVDVLWLVGPDLGIATLAPRNLGMVLQCLAALVGVGGLWIAAYTYFLKGKLLLPVNDPDLIALREHDAAHSHGHVHPA
jgi:hypothetical protein